MISDYDKIVSRAAKICSTAEKCRSDIFNKMVDWGLDPLEAERGVKYLEKNNFLDDRRYADYFVKDKLKFNKWGRIKIAYALRQKNISSEIISAALSSINSDDYENTLDNILKAKIRSARNLSSAPAKAKIFRFAAQRGFSSDEIFSAIKRLENS
jgi:regulatory protein